MKSLFLFSNYVNLFKNTVLMSCIYGLSPECLSNQFLTHSDSVQLSSYSPI